VISGPYAGSFMSDAAEEATIVGVHFKPGGAVAILGVACRRAHQYSHRSADDLGAGSEHASRAIVCAQPTDPSLPAAGADSSEEALRQIGSSRCCSCGIGRFDANAWPSEGSRYSKSCGFKPTALCRGVYCRSWPETEALRSRAAVPKRGKRRAASAM
jgi:hypothetical protein